MFKKAAILHVTWLLTGVYFKPCLNSKQGYTTLVMCDHEFRKLKGKHACNSKYWSAANLNHQKWLHIQHAFFYSPPCSLREHMANLWSVKTSVVIRWHAKIQLLKFHEYLHITFELRWISKSEMSNFLRTFEGSHPNSQSINTSTQTQAEREDDF
jgi:hypothetical protein